MVVSTGGLQTESREEEKTLVKQTNQYHLNEYPSCSIREDIGDYVAHLQFHMTLQARNLVPTLTNAKNSREQLLQQTQALFEKQVSRQSL